MSETNKETNPTEAKKAGVNKSPKLSLLKKISPESAKLLGVLREKANKKEYGRKIKEAEILDLAVKLVSQEHLEHLREKTYSAQDRLHMRHDEYQRKNGKISFDEYIEKWMNGEIGTNIS